VTRLLSPSDLAAELGISEHAARSLISTGAIEARRIGRRWYVSRPCLDAWLAPRHGATEGPSLAPRRVIGRGRQRPVPRPDLAA
jgi:excisionase family DNA binding protein